MPAPSSNRSVTVAVDVFPHARPVIAGVVAAALASLALITPAASAAADVLISGHRGTRIGAPENTMSAFAYAKRNGADIIEFDVRWTKDQRKYVLHDNRLERTTNGTGRLESHTARYIRSLKVDGGERVPSFTEITAYAKKKKLTINPEVKTATGKPFTKAQAKSYVGIIYLHSMEKKTVVSSTNPVVLNLIKKYDTKKAMRYSLIQIAGQPLHSVSDVAAMGSVYMPVYWDLTPEYVRALHDAGVQAWAWPIRNDTDRDAALALGVDVLVVDDPSAGGS